MLSAKSVLAVPMVRLLFERGEFTVDSTARAGFALMCLAPSLLTLLQYLEMTQRKLAVEPEAFLSAMPGMVPSCAVR